MPQKAIIFLENRTKFTWTKTFQDQRQMRQWDFPESIAADETASIEVSFSWGSSLLCCFNGHKASVSYRIGEKNSKAHFSLHAEYTNISVVLRGCDGLDDQNIDLGWIKDGLMPFTIASSGAELENFIASGAPAPNWMGDNLRHIGNKLLKEICLPGSHDSGMSASHHGTTFAPPENCETQKLDIAGQLQHGIRYFDIRPVITGHQCYTGHYGNTGVPCIGWQGALGQPIKEIVNEINEFTRKYPYEVIFLRVAHARNKDLNFSDFSESDWTTLFTQFDQLESRHVNLSSDKIRLAEQKINELAGVSIIVPDGTPLGERNHQGYYHQREFNVIHDYANTNDLDRMKVDQLQKMDAHSEAKDLFAVLWILTQSARNAVFYNPSVLDLAEKANQDLREVTSRISAQALVVDYASSDLTASLLPYNLFATDQEVEALGAEEA